MTLAHMLSVSVSYIFSLKWRYQTFLHSFLNCQKPVKVDLLMKRERGSKLRGLDLLQRNLSKAFKCLYYVRARVVSRLRVCM